MTYTTRVTFALFTALSMAACSPPPVMEDGGDSAVNTDRPNPPTDRPTSDRPNPPADVVENDVPAVDVPDVDAVEMDVPSADVVTADVPAVDAPSMDVPTVDVPTVDVPTVDAPSMDVPAVDVPSMDVPTVDVPPADVPTADVPTVPSMCSLATERALTLPMDTVTSAMLMGASRLPSASCSNAAGAEHIYPLTVTAPTVVTVTTTGGLDTIVSIRRDCTNMTAASEVACNDDNGMVLTSRVRARLDPGTYYVVVDSFAAMTSGTYGLTLTSAPVASNTACTAPTMLTAGVTVTGQNHASAVLGPLCGMLQGELLYYSVSVLPGQRATFTATPMGTAMNRAVLVQSMDACTGPCGGQNQSAMAGAAVTQVFDNSGATARTVTVGVVAAADTPFSVGYTLATIPPAAPNATCSAMVPTLMNGMTRMGEDVNRGGAGTPMPTMACLNTTTGRSLYFQVSVPANSNLDLVATPAGGWNPFIRLLPTCGAAMCTTATNAAAAGAPERLFYSNSTASAQTLFVEVGSTAAGVGGTFDLATTITTGAFNSACTTPITLMSGVMINNANPASTALSSTSCLGTGRQLYYRMSVPAGERLTVRSTPVNPTDGAIIGIQPTCASMTCSARAQSPAAGAAATTFFDNRTAAAVDVIVAVAGGAQNILPSLSLVPIAYNITRITNACVDTTAGTAVAGVDVDDAVSTTQMLPFAFRLSGEAMALTHYSVSSNGFIGLLPNAASMLADAPTNANIPTTAAPNAVIAPFWDDLFPSTTAGVTATTRTLVTGMAPSRRFVVEWAGRGLWAAGMTPPEMTANIRFQLHLVEATRTVEFHYCSLVANMAPAARTRASSATIGVESSDGLSGGVASFDTEVTNLAMQGYLLTPTM
jgi:hypothetical protein